MLSTSVLNWDQRVTAPEFNLSASERKSAVMRQTSSQVKSKAALLMLQRGVLLRAFFFEKGISLFRLKEH